MIASVSYSQGTVLWPLVSGERRKTTRTCKGKVKVLGNHLEVLRDHTHGPEQHKVSALKALQSNEDSGTDNR